MGAEPRWDEKRPRQERGRGRRDLFLAPSPGLLPVGWDLGQEPGVISVPRRAGTAQGTAPPARIRQGVHTTMEIGRASCRERV